MFAFMRIDCQLYSHFDKNRLGEKVHDILTIGLCFLLIYMAYKIFLEYTSYKYINKYNKDKNGFLNKEEFSNLQTLILTGLSTQQQSQIIKMLKLHLIANVQELKTEENDIDLKFNEYIEKESSVWFKNTINQYMIDNKNFIK